MRRAYARDRKRRPIERHAMGFLLRRLIRIIKQKRHMRRAGY
jgi:hypothetical protein